MEPSVGRRLLCNHSGRCFQKSPKNRSAFHLVPTLGEEKTGDAALTLGGHPKPANDKARGIDSDGVVSVGMINVLSAEKREQVVALGRLGWSLRRIEQTTGLRRETGSGYLKAAGASPLSD